MFRLTEIPKGIKYPNQILISSLSGEFSQSNLNACPDLNCKIERGQSENAEAVIFKMSANNIGKRKPNQYFVFFSQESPMHTGVRSPPYPGFFNLTMGYRRDASIPCPYGYSVKLKSPQSYVRLTKEELANKTKPIAWFVSNCNTPGKREQYVGRLKQHHPVDIYGGCGTLRCPKPAQNCNHLLKQHYRFYLAFENSICRDYLTEKLWNQGYQANVVPIVLKDSLVKDFVPPGSYIAADQFRSAKELSEYISYLMKNDTAYLEYFQWKENYQVKFMDGRTHDHLERPWGLCRLCALLRQEPRPTKIVHDFQNWWNGPAICDNGLVNRI